MKTLLVAASIILLAAALRCSLQGGEAEAASAPAAPAKVSALTTKELARIGAALEAIAAENARVKNRPTDFPPAGGGGWTGPYGRTCAEARERMRWHDMPCSPLMPER